LQILRQIADVRDPRTGAIVLDKGTPPKPRGRFIEPDMGVQGAEAAKILGEMLRDIIPALADKLRASEPATRLAALALIEQLGPDAKITVPAVTAALHDPDRFVRWAAARSLGRIGITNFVPANHAPAVEGLADLMMDDDLDVSMGAARALEDFGEAALPAVPALAKALSREDPDLRANILYTLKAIGPKGTAAIEPLTKLLTAKEARIRREVPPILAMYRAEAKSAVPALRAALDDPDSEVRDRASEAILQIAGK
jgi:HEAT repeat protein